MDAITDIQSCHWGKYSADSLQGTEIARVLASTRAQVYCSCGGHVLQSPTMKTLTVRLPEALVSQIERESRRRKLSKSDVVRERLSAQQTRGGHPAALDAIADLIGSIDELPADLGVRKKDYLKATGYGRKRHR
jgi:Arc/MetJ-type ribon-helix-helix transcriptional regulator